MRIGFDARYTRPSRAGLGQVVHYLLGEYLRVQSSHEFHLFRHVWPVDDTWLSDRRVHVHHVRSGSPKIILDSRERWDQISLPVSLLLHRIDVYHATGLVAPLLTPCPVVLTLYDLTFLMFPHFHDPISQSYLARWVPRSVRRATHLIAISETTKRDAVKYWNLPPSRISVIPLGVHPRFRPLHDNAAVENVLQQYDLPPAKNYILFVGTLEPRKNLVRLVNAYESLIHNQGCNHQLVLCGRKGWLYDEIFAAVSRAGLQEKIVFAQNVPDEALPYVYSGSVALIYPSLYEGFGLPVLEAMACGTPVITSNVSSLPEVAGEAALLIDPTDTKQIAQAMERVCSDPELRSVLAERGRTRSLGFSWRNTAEQTMRVYEQVVNQKRDQES